MANSKLQHARNLPQAEKIPYGEALPFTNALATPVSGVEVDISGYAARDRQLQWRDIIVAAAISKIARRASTIFAAAYPFPQVPISPDVQKTWTTLGGGLVENTASDSAILSGSSETYSSLSAPLNTGSVTIKTYDGETLVSESSDDGNGLIVSKGAASDTDLLTPKGTITGGFVNYDTGYVQVLVKPYPGKTLRCTYAAVTQVNAAPATVSAGVVQINDRLAKTPVEAGSVEIHVGESRAIDNTRGKLVPSGQIAGGEIDYSTGRLVVRLRFNELGTSYGVKYDQQVFLTAAEADISQTQSGSAPGGIVGVRHVDNSSVPENALVSDQDLFVRDLVLYEVLTAADEVFRYAWRYEPSQLIRSIKPQLAPGIIGDAWSKALAQAGYTIPQFGQDWSPGVFLKADQYLAWRDNILAPYVAELSYRLASDQFVRSELQALATEDGQDILVEDDTLAEEQP